MSLIDQLHPVEPEGLRHYNTILHTGKTYGLDKSLGVAIIARNCENSIGRTLQTVNMVSKHFLCTNVMIYTNDCTDGTVKAIADSPLPEVDVMHVDEELDFPDLSGTRLATRTINLAHCRNECMSYLKPYETDVVLVLDADLLEVTSDRLLAGYGEMVHRCFDAMAAQNLVLAPQVEKERLVSYDAFAFRPAWGDCTSYMIERAFHYDVRPAGTPAYIVRSAFGGACWYKGDYYFDGRKYDGEHGCEHVPFNRGLLMGICPSMSLVGFI